MKKIFISGDPTHPLFHRYQNVSSQLESIYDGYEIAVISEHYETFETQDYQKYDLAVLYTDHWIDKTGTTHSQVQALLDYIAQGGALLLIHNLDLGVDPALAQMIGARLRHPLKDQGGLRKLVFHADPSHPAAEGVEVFTLEDERFPVDYAPFCPRNVFLTAEAEDGTVTDAGWSVEFGKGRLIYLMPGHLPSAFDDLSMRKLIRQSSEWLMRER